MSSMSHRIIAALLTILAGGTAHGLTLDARDIVSAPRNATLVRIDPSTGDATVISGDGVGSGPPLAGGRIVPIIRDCRDIVVTGNDNILLVDPTTGNRTIISGCDDGTSYPGCSLVGDGPDSFSAPGGIAVETDGNILVMDSRAADSILFRVDPVSGDRAIVSSASIGSGGPIPGFPGFGIAGHLARESDGQALVYSGQFCALLRVDTVTGDRSVLSRCSFFGAVGNGIDFGEISQMAVEADGNIVLASTLSSSTRREEVIIRVDAVTGDRAVVSGCSFQCVGDGPEFVDRVDGIAVEPGGDVIATDTSWIYRVDRLTGDRVRFTDSQLGGGLATVPAFPDTDGDRFANCADNCIAHANASQHDSDIDGLGNRCDGDFNNDCRINFSDLGQFKDAYLSTPISPNWNPDMDLNGDEIINLADLDIMKQLFFSDLTTGNPSGLPNICDSN